MNNFFDIRQNCPACSSVTVKTIYRNPFDQEPISDYLQKFYGPQDQIELSYLSGGQYILNECEDCDLIYQKEIPNKQLMERLYGKWMDPAKTFMKEKSKDRIEYYAYYAREILRLIAYFKKPPSELTFFDFGMGWGKWALMAKAFGCKVFGSELSGDRIKFAISNGLDILDWNEISKHEFDFINTEQVFEHIPYPYETLCHLKKALRSGGLVKISVPTANDIKRRLAVMNWDAKKGSKNSLNPVAPLEHINCYQRSSITKMAQRAGLQEVFIPLHIQYRYLLSGNGLRNIARSLYSPLQVNVFRKLNYLFFRPAMNI